MNKITSIKIKYADGSYSGQIPISVLAENINWDDTHSIIDAIGDVDINTTGSLQNQINKKVNTTDLSDYVNGQLAGDVANWLDTYIKPVGTTVAIDKTLSIPNAAADAKAVKNELDLKFDKSNIKDIISLSTGEINFDRPEASNNKYPVSMENGNVIVDGRINAGCLRVMIYGNEKLYCLDYKPAYKESIAYIYHDSIQSFIIGHTVQINIQLIDGNYQLDNLNKVPGITLWNKANSDKIFFGFNKDTWVVTEQPELVAFCLYPGEYNNAVFKVTFVDLTALEQHPIISLASNKIETSVNDINNKIIDLKNEIKGKVIEFDSGDGQSLNLPISKNGKYITINGALSAENNRIRIYGDFDTSIKAPTYQNCSNWYGDPIDNFIVGHNIKVEAKLISGSYDLVGYAQTYFDFRKITGGEKIIAQPISGTSFKIEEIPEMVCVGFKEGSYDNAIFEIQIKDILNDTLIKEIQKIKNSISPISYEVPEIFQNQLERAITRINSQTNSSDYDAFIFITDPHWYRNKKQSPALIKALIERTPVQTVICGGDIIHSHFTTKQKAINQLKDWENAIKGTGVNEYYCIFGNHDDNSNGSPPVEIRLGKKEVFGLLYGSFAYQSNVHWAPYTNWADYYVDHDISKTRYICLDWIGTQDSGDRGQWLKDVLDIDDGYRVLIFHHGVYQYNSSTQGISATGKLNILTAITDLYPNKVKAIIQGHVHLDGLFLQHSAPIIITSCDTYQNNLGAYQMTQGTLDQQCFDVMVVDYSNSKIYTTRIGRFGWEPDKNEQEIMDREIFISTDQ